MKADDKRRGATADGVRPPRMTAHVLVDPDVSSRRCRLMFCFKAMMEVIVWYRISR